MGAKHPEMGKRYVHRDRGRNRLLLILSVNQRQAHTNDVSFIFDYPKDYPPYWKAINSG
jgi:hypothetical protein